RVGDLRASPSAPPVIVQVRADGRELALGGTPAVPHGAWLAVRVASPGGSERTYQWRMQPEDADWSTASTRPEAVLPTRDGGEHRLLVRAAARGSNLWGPAAQLRLRVATAWYRRWWGVASVGAVLALVFGVGLLLARAVAAGNERRLNRLVAARTRELREASQRFTAVFESAPMGIAIADLEGRFLEVNDTLLEVLGYTRDEMKAMTVLELTHPDDREGTSALAGSVRSGEAARYDIEKRYLKKDGTPTWVRVHSTALRTPQGAVEYWVGLVEDITARRRLDQEKAELQSQLLQAQKMESVGRLAGGVAHDFNNMLHVIMGFVELLRRKIPAAGRPSLYVAEIERAARRAQEVTRQLLAFSRKQVITPAPSNLNRLVARLGGALSRLIGEDVRLHVHAAEDLWTVNVDPTQFDQILLNLAVNARDAMPAGGRLTIETANVRLDESYCRTHAAARPGDYVLLAVSDDGIGMDRDTLSRLFEPFFTTKEKGKGTGLGLAMVHGIVEQNGGFVSVYSEPGGGTTFRVYLPRTLGESSPSAAPPPSESEVTGGTTVLVVEDEASVRRLTTALVESIGCRVVPASSGAEAVELCRRDDTRIDVVLTDVVMPGMSGIELRDWLQEVRPGIRILFTSGYTANVIAHHGILDKGVHFIPKPFGVAELARALRELLASP
ncbi:MAG TPA: PAS domain S-box protein, partial [Vicinamibacteria bacterium]|nr:PAS domain S-box protein [Vicinamibacteria bacterium]